mgnify:FL=1
MDVALDSGKGTLTGETQRVEEYVLFVGEVLYYGVEELVGHVVFAHLFGSEEVLVVHDQQTRYFLKNLMSQIVPSVLLQVTLY